MAALDQVLKVIFQGDSRGLSASLRGVQGELKSFGNVAQRTFSGISSAFAALGVTLSAGAFAVGIKKIIDGFDQLNDATQQLGLSSEALSEFGYAAEQSGLSVEELQTGLKFLNKNLIEAQQGNKALATTFREYGVNAIDDTETALAKLADAFAAMPDGARKTNAALEIFGKSGVRLIPFLNNGATGLAKLREEAVRLGISIGGDTVKAADEFNDRMNTIGNAVKGVGVAIAKAALPSLSQLAEGMANAAKSGGSLTDIIGALAREIVALFKFGAGSSKQGLLGEMDKLEEKMKRLLEDRAAWEKQMANPATPDKSLFKTDRGDLGKALEANQKQIIGIEEEYAKLAKQLVVLQQAEIAAAGGAKELGNSLQYVGPMAKLTADEIVGLSGKYKTLIKDIKDARKDALASPLKDVKDSSVLTINRLKDDAQKALEGGDAEAAERLIKQAAAVNNYLLETKQITKSYYDTQAAAILLLAEQGQAVIDSGEPLTLPVAPSIEDAMAAGQLAWSTAQEAVNAKGPITIPGIVQVGDASFVQEEKLQLPGYARGGPIRGPGTGLSDSILARLSAGEFVVKAAAVKNYGLGFLERLNSMSLPRFAAGGPVGTPINIHLDGHQYPMTAAPSVAKELGRLLGVEVLKRGRR